MSRIVIALSVFLGMVAGPAFAAGVDVSDAWTRATAPGQTVAGVYFDLKSVRDAKLVGVQTSMTDKAEIHIMSMDDGVMRMRPVASIDLPAGETVKFKPGGYHVMLFDLKKPLEAGGQMALALLVEDAKGEVSRVIVTVEVRNLDGSKAGQHHH
ncbi:MAG: copper chaperone PCu(A)C [Burkholderiales bacterium]|jgi:copper(I)-binding protein